MGRLYAVEGRLGDWVVDNTNYVLRDPNKNIILYPGEDDDPDSAFIVCGNTVFYGDGHIDGACRNGLTVNQNNPKKIDSYPSDPVWSIDKDGKADFSNPESTMTVKQITIPGGTSLTGSSWNLPAGTTMEWGGETLSVNNEGFNFSGNVSISGNATFEDNININSGKGISIGSGQGIVELNQNGIHIGQGIRLSTSGNTELPTTKFTGTVDMNGEKIKGADEITCKDLTCQSLSISDSFLFKGEFIEDYIKNLIKTDDLLSYIRSNLSVTIGDTITPAVGSAHHHTASIS
jgi:hypothetical protein